jgi:hypothetical protein
MYVLLSWIGIETGCLCTASRDGVVKIWKIIESNSTLNVLYSFSPFDGVAVTAVDVIFASFSISTINDAKQGYLMAVGSENGEINIYSISIDLLSTDCCSFVSSVSKWFSHGSSINRIKWKQELGNKSIIPLIKENGKIITKFASCGDDHTVRIFSVTI